MSALSFGPRARRSSPYVASVVVEPSDERLDEGALDLSETAGDWFVGSPLLEALDEAADAGSLIEWFVALEDRRRWAGVERLLDELEEAMAVHMPQAKFAEKLHPRDRVGKWIAKLGKGAATAQREIVGDVEHAQAGVHGMKTDIETRMYDMAVPEAVPDPAAVQKEIKGLGKVGKVAKEGAAKVANPDRARLAKQKAGEKMLETVPMAALVGAHKILATGADQNSTANALTQGLDPNQVLTLEGYLESIIDWVLQSMNLVAQHSDTIAAASHTLMSLISSEHDEFDGDWATELMEGAYWDPAKHPRWPSGTPGGLGGQFMRVGQRFRVGGIDYDVAAVFPGHIYAHVAGGPIGGKEPKTVRFDADTLEDFVHDPEGAVQGKAKLPTIKGVERPPAEAIKGAKADTLHMTATVLDPYVDPATHDPKIPLPEGSTITPEEWQRFGRLDQERYAQLMEKFGKWSPGAAQKHVDEALSKADSGIKQMLLSSYSSQFGSSTGFTISLHSIFGNLLSAVKGSSQVEEARKKYEKGRALQDEAASALQWDLYNRVHAPDVAIFHKNSAPGLFTNEIIKGKKPVFAGLSQSQWYRTGFFGNFVLATPMAIRHIVMATTSADIYKGHGFKSEWEVATADSFNADSRSLSFGDPGGTNGTHPALTQMQAKWLHKITENGASGAILEQLKDSFKDGGASLPVPPEPPHIVMDGSGGKQWVAPPAEATQFAMVDGVKTSVLALDYATKDENGSPVAKQIKQMVEDGELVPGDYIEGMKGTRYIIVQDPSDSYLGMAYYKISDTGTAVGPKLHIDLTNQDYSAFTSHKLWTGNTEVYQFQGGGELAFKKLKGHYDLPTPAEEAGTGFHPEAWSPSAPDQQKFLSKFDVGQKFKVNGVAYEVTDHLAGQQVKIKNLDTGKYGQINGDYKSTWLVLKEGYTEVGTAVLDPHDFLKGDAASLKDLGLHMGDLVMLGQTVHKVETVEEDGKLGLTQMSGANVGKTAVVDPAQQVGRKLFVKPAYFEPKVGDVLGLDGKKAVLKKVMKNGELQFNLSPGVVKLKPDDARLADLYTPDDYVAGDKVKLKMMAAGQKFHAGSGQKVKPYVVIDQNGKVAHVKNLETGEVMELSAAKSFALLNPKAKDPVEHPTAPAPHDLTAFDPSGFEAGAPKKLADLEPGDIFTWKGSYFQVDEPGVAHSVLSPDSKMHYPTTPGSAGDTVMTTLVPKGSKADSADALSASIGGVASTDPDAFDPGAWEQVGGEVLGKDLKAGMVVLAPNGSTYWKITGDNGSAATALTDAPSGGVQAGENVTGLALEAKFTVLKPKGALAEIHGSFDPSAFNPVLDMQGNVAAFKLGQLKAGDVFKGKTGQFFQIKKISGNNVYAKNLVTGKDTKLAASITAAAALVPKTESKTPYADLKPGDPVQLSDLKVGDQFKVSGVNLFEVTKVADPNVEGSKPEVGAVNSAGQVTAPWPAFPGSDVVTLHAKAADKAKPLSGDELAKVVVDPSTLETLTDHGYDSYLHPKSGTKHYPKLSTMPEGTVFHDKGGQVYRVEQAGGQPIVTDGKTLFAADGDLRGFAVENPSAYAKQFENAPSAPSNALEVQTAVAGLKVSKNTSGKSLAVLGVAEGDMIGTLGGHTYVVHTVTETPDGTQVTAYEAATGKEKTFSAGWAPLAFAKGHGDPFQMEEPEVDTGENAPGKPGVLIGDLHVGDVFKTSSGDVWKVKDFGAKFDSDGDTQLPITMEKIGVEDATFAVPEQPITVTYPTGMTVESWTLVSQGPQAQTASYIATPPDGWQLAGASKTAAQLEEGDAFLMPSTGMLYEVRGKYEKSGTAVLKLKGPAGEFEIEAWSLGDQLSPTSDASTTVPLVKKIADIAEPEPPKAKVADTHHYVAQKTLETLEPGDIYTAVVGSDHTASNLFQVNSTKKKGEYLHLNVTKVASDGTGDDPHELGETWDVKLPASTVMGPAWVFQPNEAPASWGPGAHANAAGLQLGHLSEGAEFTTDKPVQKGVVFKVASGPYGSGKNKLVKIEVVYAPKESGFDVGETGNMAADTVPVTWGLPGSHLLDAGKEAPAAPALDAVSTDPADYVDGEKTFLEKLPVGATFRPATKPDMLFQVTGLVGDSDPTMKVKNLKTGEEMSNVSKIMAVVELKPKAADAPASPSSELWITKAQPEVGGWGVTADKIEPGDVFAVLPGGSVKFQATGHFDDGTLQAVELVDGEPGDTGEPFAAKAVLYVEGKEPPIGSDVSYHVAGEDKHGTYQGMFPQGDLNVDGHAIKPEQVNSVQAPATMGYDTSVPSKSLADYVAKPGGKIQLEQLEVGDYYIAKGYEGSGAYKVIGKDPSKKYLAILDVTKDPSEAGVIVDDISYEPVSAGNITQLEPQAQLGSPDLVPNVGQKSLKEMKQGEKFGLDGKTYVVDGKVPGANVVAAHQEGVLASGQSFSADFAPAFVQKSLPTGDPLVPQFAVGDKVKTPLGTVMEVEKITEIGDLMGKVLESPNNPAIVGNSFSIGHDALDDIEKIAGGPETVGVFELPPAPKKGKLTEFEAGDLVQGGPYYKSGVYRITNVENGVYTLKLVVAKHAPGYSAVADDGTMTVDMNKTGNYYNSYQNATYELHAGPLWKKGEYARVTKPGNKTGKTALVMGHDEKGDNIVQFNDGKIDTVPDHWLSYINVTSVTTSKNQLPKVKAGRMSIGDKVIASVMQNSGYSSYATKVTGWVKEKTPDQVTIQTQDYNGNPGKEYVIASTDEVTSLVDTYESAAVKEAVGVAKEQEATTGGKWIKQTPGAAGGLAAKQMPPGTLLKGGNGGEWEILEHTGPGKMNIKNVATGKVQDNVSDWVPQAYKLPQGTPVSTTIFGSANPESGDEVPMNQMPVNTLFVDHTDEGSTWKVSSYVKLDNQGNWLAVQPKAASHIHATTEEGGSIYVPVTSGKAQKSYLVTAPTVTTEEEHPVVDVALNAPQKVAGALKKGDLAIYDNKVYEVTSKAVDGGHAMLMFSQPDGTGQVALPATSKVVPLPKPPAKMPAGSLGEGDWFQTGALHGLPAGVYEVTGTDGKKVMVKSVDSYNTGWVGDELEVTPVGKDGFEPSAPSGMSYDDIDALTPEEDLPQVGDMVKPDVLKQGMVVETTLGDHYEVTENPTPTGDGWIVPMKLTKSVSGPPVGSTYDQMFLDSTEWKLISTGPTGGSYPLAPITGYEWPKSGKKHFPHVSTLKPGTLFKGKGNAAVWKVVGTQENGDIAVQLGGGDIHALPPTTRVFVVAP